MSQSPSAPSLVHHDLRSGATARVPRQLTSQLRSAIEQSALEAARERCIVRLADTPFALFTDLLSVEDGNAGYYICTAEPVPGGKIGMGAPLYFGAIACQLPTAPLMWRYILRRYYSTLTRAPMLRMFSAPGLMPQEFPWGVGFDTPEASMLPQELRAKLTNVQQLTALFLLPRCEQGWLKTAEAGDPPVLDPELFPELADWSD